MIASGPILSGFSNRLPQIICLGGTFFKKPGRLQKPTSHLGMAKLVENPSSFPAFANQPAGAHDHQVLRYTRVADAKGLLQGIHIMFPVPQLLNDADPVWMRKRSQEFRKFLDHQSTVRQSAPSLRPKDSNI